MILDLHVHTDASDDSRAPIEGYLRWIENRRATLPIDGVVLTEHRHWDPGLDYRALEDRFGILILRGVEVETDYGHVLLYGVSADTARYIDFANVHLDAQMVVTEVARMGGIAAPCHPGRPTVGLCDHYSRGRPLQGVVAVEALNGGSRRGENERVRQLIERYGYRGFGGSDSHLVSMIGICATEFDVEIRSAEDLVHALNSGTYRPVDNRERM